MHAPSHTVTRSGFTLVELLVTIAILAVLAALAFLAIRKGIERANGARDMATMRQVFQAISDLDQLHPDVKTPGWKKDIPAGMSHGTYRIAIFFDGRAGKLDEDNNPL